MMSSGSMRLSSRAPWGRYGNEWFPLSPSYQYDNVTMIFEPFMKILACDWGREQGSNVYQKANISTEVEITANLLHLPYPYLVPLSLEYYLTCVTFAFPLIWGCRPNEASNGILLSGLIFWTWSPAPFPSLHSFLLWPNPPQVFSGIILTAACPLARLNSSCTALAYSLLKHSFQIRKGTAEGKGFHDGR